MAGGRYVMFDVSDELLDIVSCIDYLVIDEKKK